MVEHARKALIAGNWKMNLDHLQQLRWSKSSPGR